MSAPPRLASWLLNQFLVGKRRESVIGDLTERYAARPSAAWYWRQVVTTIIVSFIVQTGAHICLALAVVVMNAYLLPFVFVRVMTRWISMTERLWQPRLLEWLSASDLYGLYAHSLALFRFSQMALVYCGMLSAFAFILVRLRPDLRGLLLSALLLSAIAQGVPTFLSDINDWLAGSTNAIQIRGFLFHSLFTFVAVPYSILKWERPLRRSK